nr:MAG TPA: hypothetical protein [Bacteriophage sp.]
MNSDKATSAASTYLKIKSSAWSSGTLFLIASSTSPFLMDSFTEAANYSIVEDSSILSSMIDLRI